MPIAVIDRVEMKMYLLWPVLGLGLSDQGDPFAQRRFKHLKEVLSIQNGCNRSSYIGGKTLEGSQTMKENGRLRPKASSYRQEFIGLLDLLFKAEEQHQL